MSQIVIERITSLTPEDVLSKAKKTFLGEQGMTLEYESPCCLRFKDNAGFLYITVEEEGNKTKVEIKSREWAEASKKFLKKL